MMLLLRDLCGGREHCERDLVRSLRDGTTDAHSLFGWAVKRLASDLIGSEEDLLLDYVNGGFRPPARAGQPSWQQRNPVE